MKCLILFAIIVSCNTLNERHWAVNITGTYIRYAEHEFGKEFDTLIISELPDQFQIVRKWKYERVLDGVVQEPEYKQETNTATYDCDHRLLHENETGNTISFDQRQGILFIGPTKYKKLK